MKQNFLRAAAIMLLISVSGCASNGSRTSQAAIEERAKRGSLPAKLVIASRYMKEGRHDLVRPLLDEIAGQRGKMLDAKSHAAVILARVSRAEFIGKAGGYGYSSQEVSKLINKNKKWAYKGDITSPIVLMHLYNRRDPVKSAVWRNVAGKLLDREDLIDDSDTSFSRKQQAEINRLTNVVWRSIKKQ